MDVPSCSAGGAERGSSPRGFHGLEFILSEGVVCRLTKEEVPLKLWWLRALSGGPDDKPKETAGGQQALQVSLTVAGVLLAFSGMRSCSSSRHI